MFHIFFVTIQRYAEYGGTIIQESECIPVKIYDDDGNYIGEAYHALLVVGYGEKMGVKYWKVKNSWGSDKAEGGYVLIERGTNYCGLADVAIQII